MDKKTLQQAIETLVHPTKAEPRSTRLLAKFDFQFQTFNDPKLTEMLAECRRFCAEMALDGVPRWLSLLGVSGTGKTHLARKIARFFERHCEFYTEPATGAQLCRRGGFKSWRRACSSLRDGDYEIADALSRDFFVALDDIGAEMPTPFVISKLDDIIDSRLNRWTVITANFNRAQIAEKFDIRIASRLGRGNNVIVDNIDVVDFSLRQK